MNVQIQTVHFDASKQLMEHLQKRVDKLKTFHDKITDVEIYLEMESMSQKVKDKIAKIRVDIPGHSLFAQGESKVFEASFDKAFDSMVTQIKKAKEKQQQKAVA